MVAGFFPAAGLACDPALNEPRLQGWAQQKVINAQPRGAGEGVTEVFPERIDALARIELAQGVAPPKLQGLRLAWRTSGRNSSSSRQRSGA
jgi:hypothetical protein